MVKFREASLGVCALVLCLATGFWPRVGAARYHGPNALLGEQIGAHRGCLAEPFRIGGYATCAAGLSCAGNRLALGFPTQHWHSRYVLPGLFKGRPISSGQVVRILPALGWLGGNPAVVAGGTGKRRRGGPRLGSAWATAAVAEEAVPVRRRMARKPRRVHYRAIILAAPKFARGQAGAAFEERNGDAARMVTAAETILDCKTGGSVFRRRAFDAGAKRLLLPVASVQDIPRCRANYSPSSKPASTPTRRMRCLRR